MNRRLLALAALLLVAGAARAANTAESGTLVPDNQDLVLSFFSSAASDRFDLTLESYRDLNDDGDFADASEVTIATLLSDVTGCATTSRWSCRYQTGANTLQTFVMRNASADHIPGRNFTATIVLETSLGTVVDRYVHGFRIDGIPATSDHITAEHQGTRTRINDTNCLQNQCTQYLAGRFNDTITAINDVDSDLAHHEAHNHIDFPYTWTLINATCHPATCNGSGNADPLNHTALRASIASDCHGTGADYCINGHTPNLYMDQWLRVALALALVLALGWFSLRPGFMPLISLFGGFALFFYHLAVYNTLTQSTIFNTILLFLPLVVSVISIGRLVYEQQEAPGDVLASDQ